MTRDELEKQVADGIKAHIDKARPLNMNQARDVIAAYFDEIEKHGLPADTPIEEEVTIEFVYRPTADVA